MAVAGHDPSQVAVESTEKLAQAQREQHEVRDSNTLHSITNVKLKIDKCRPESVDDIKNQSIKDEQAIE